jgi:hypothetical protein
MLNANEASVVDFGPLKMTMDQLLVAHPRLKLLSINNEEGNDDAKIVAAVYKHTPKQGDREHTKRRTVIKCRYFARFYLGSVLYETYPKDDIVNIVECRSDAFPRVIEVDEQINCESVGSHTPVGVKSFLSHLFVKFCE